jgi:N-glycosylase/DNA lyase
MKLTEIPAPDFDLAMTLDSGQVFHWETAGRGFLGAIGDEPIYLEQRGHSLFVPVGLAELVRNYFALDHPLTGICASFPDDPIMNAARSSCRGLRIIRQPRWECLATFITSSMKQVAHIRQISRELRRRFGRECRVGDQAVRTFPSSRRIAQSSEKELRECALGYRAKNLLATARLVSSGEADLEAWAALSDTDLGVKLCSLPGVGAKVANCVMLFAYERLRAFPIDVWIERVLRQHYFPGKRKMTARQLRIFSENYFGDHGGYAQQYLFHHARTASRGSGVKRASSTWLRSARNDSEEGARVSSRNGGRRAVGTKDREWDTAARVRPGKQAIEVNRPYPAHNRRKGRGGSPNRPGAGRNLSAHRA